MVLLAYYLYGLLIAYIALKASDERGWRENRVGGWVAVLFWPISVPALILLKILDR